MTCGIYYYWDNEKDELAYIGRSNNCERRRREHLNNNKESLQFDKILQKNPKRYDFNIMLECTQEELDSEEILAIKMYKPKFNFHIGGTGFGFGKNNPSYGGLSDKHKKNISKGSIGKKISKEARKKMSENHADVSGVNNPMYGKKHTKEVKEKISLNQSRKRNTSGYYRVYKKKDISYKQNSKWVYRYYDDTGKRKEISSGDIKKLEEKVKAKKLKWLKFGD